jgi:hypothetical protein
MTFAEFMTTLSTEKAPADLSPALVALWWDARDDWDAAHKIVMDESGKDCAWVHAYLHRREGDLDNAGYWYKQAGQPIAKGPLSDEWSAITHAILGGDAPREWSGRE